ncbi:MAG: glycosyltransferase [Desulfobacterales bacterium]|nr:glycosyltransferase [Desulfobacterales bacterium]
MTEVQSAGRGFLFFDTSHAGDAVQNIKALLHNGICTPNLHAVFAVSYWVKERIINETEQQIPGIIEFIDLPAAVSEKKRKFKDVFGALRCIRLSEKLADRYHCDQIYFLHLDTFMAGLFIRLFFPSRFFFSGLFFRPLEHYPERFGNNLTLKEKLLSFFKAKIFRRFLASSKIRTIHCYDKYFVEYCQPLKHSDKVRYLPDFSFHPPDMAPPRISIENWIKSKNKFLLFGHLTERKGVLKLLESIKFLDSDHLNASAFLICGKIDRRIQQEIDAVLAELHALGKDKQVHIINDFLDDKKIWYLINACHLVLLPYQRHPGSSGILSWAASAGKPVLAQSFGLLGHEVEKWGLGVTADTGDSKAIALALTCFVQKGVEGIVDANKQAKYKSLHSEKNFASSLLNSLGPE